MRITLFLAAALLVQFAGAQTINHKSTLSISAGPSVPIGDFGKTDLSNASSGFAGTGQALSISFSHLLQKQFGVSVKGYFQRNPLDTDEMERSFSNARMYHGMVSFSPVITPQNPQATYSVYPEWEFEKGSWILGSLLVGGFAQLPVANSDKLFLNANAMLGVGYVSSPELNGSGRSDTGFARIHQSDSHAFGLTYFLSTGIRYVMNHRLSAFAATELVGTNKMTFKDVTASMTSGKGPTQNPSTIQHQQITGNMKQSVRAVNISIGLSLSL